LLGPRVDFKHKGLTEAKKLISSQYDEYGKKKKIIDSQKNWYIFIKYIITL